ncbi:alpha/beta hydrolase [Niveispirillum sp. KHB5.9]|uniref:alpha/beta hydrolase n=1 Tax=Niveispirillum sp. KHB5.9 TaxID=3400269 RepID=UPI003A838A72
MARTWKRLASTLMLALALTGLAAAQAQQAQQTPPGYTMPSTHMFDITSDGGDIYRIFVSFPATEMPADGYPVLYVLDGNAMFASFAEARRIQEYYEVGKGIVVGVGYPGDQAYDVRRLDDYTPLLVDPPPPNVRHLAKYKSGGQDKFLDFLTGKLRTEISRRYKINADRQSLFGHSLGGLVALHTLYTRPQAFHSIVAASPSLEWNDQSILKEEREFTARVLAGKVPRTSRLMVVVGDRDIDDEPGPAAAFMKRMDALAVHGLRSRFHRYADEGHMTVPVRAVPDTLRFAFEVH